MPQGKPAGVRCVHLDVAFRCELWGTDQYPAVCRDFPADRAVCGESREEAVRLLEEWEDATKP